MKRIKMSKSQWQGIGKKAGWLNEDEKHKESAEEQEMDLSSLGVTLKRVGPALCLMQGDKAILHTRVQEFVSFLEHLAVIVKEDEIERGEREL